LSAALVHEAVRREESKLASLASGQGKEDATALRTRMQDIMTAKVGVFRTGAMLAEAVEELTTLLRRSRDIGLRYRAAGATAERATAVEKLRSGMQGASRTEIQRALMPCESLLPERYRGGNEQIDDILEAATLPTPVKVPA